MHNLEAHLPLRSAVRESGNIGQQPGKLRRREVWVDDEPGRCGDMGTPPFFNQLGAEGCGAAVLPDNSIGERLGRRPLPDKRRLALVGDADGSDACRTEIAERLASRRQHRLPDFFRIVLHPARRWVNLGERPLRDAAGTALPIKGDRARARRALVDGKDKGTLAHGRAALTAASRSPSGS